MKVLLTNNQQSQKFSTAFGTVRKDMILKGVRSFKNIESVAAAERRQTGEFAASVAFKLTGNGLEANKDISSVFPITDNSDVFQLGVKGSDISFDNPFVLIFNNRVVFENGHLANAFTPFLERMKRLLITIKESTTVDRPVANSPKENVMREFLSAGENVKFESKEFAQDVLGIKNIVNSLLCAIRKIEGSLKANGKKS